MRKFINHILITYLIKHQHDNQINYFSILQYIINSLLVRLLFKVNPQIFITFYFLIFYLFFK